MRNLLLFQRLISFLPPVFSSSEELAAMLKRSKERKGTRDPFGAAASRGSLRVVVSVKPSTMYFSQPSYANGFKVSSPATIASAASLTPSFSPLATVSPSLSLSIPLTGKRKSMISSSRGKKDLKRTLLWLSDGEVSSEQKLLFSRAKVEHISGTYISLFPFLLFSYFLFSFRPSHYSLSPSQLFV
jgi:hypothetical protein